MFDYVLFFFFKQKTAYDMRISDWSSDVCSSDLRIGDIVTSALPTVALPDDFTNVSQCNENLTGYPDVPRDPIKGVVIYAIVEPIDGPGNVLGSAGRSEDRRGGNECVSRCRSRWSPEH